MKSAYTGNMLYGSVFLRFFVIYNTEILCFYIFQGYYLVLFFCFLKYVIYLLLQLGQKLYSPGRGGGKLGLWANSVFENEV